MRKCWGSPKNEGPYLYCIFHKICLGLKILCMLEHAWEYPICMLVSHKIILILNHHKNKQNWRILFLKCRGLFHSLFLFLCLPFPSLAYLSLCILVRTWVKGACQTVLVCLVFLFFLTWFLSMIWTSVPHWLLNAHFVYFNTIVPENFENEQLYVKPVIWAFHPEDTIERFSFYLILELAHFTLVVVLNLMCTQTS